LPGRSRTPGTRLRTKRGYELSTRTGHGKIGRTDVKCLKCVRSAALLRTLCDGAEECGGGDDREGPHHCVVVMEGIGIECPREERSR